ncbi:MAG: S24/S26 family peptidase, partial [Endomicrobiales bacterium]|nr:S24/S26 family peptidase [Endomicrobiales bacterium]
MTRIIAVKTTGGSMRPSIKSRETLFVEAIPPEVFKPGDTALYEHEGKKFIHRITNICTSADKKLIFTLSGDSAVTGEYTVDASRMIGRPITHLNGFYGLVLNSILSIVFSILRPLKKALFPLAFFLLLSNVAPDGLSAATRIKTVEWNYGGYYSSSDVNTWTPPYIYINLPDAIATSPIKNAYLEISYLDSAGSASDTTDIDIYFNTGASPTDTVDNITGNQVPDSSGESQPMRVRADVTSKITSWSSQNYSMRIQISGSDFNMCAAKLYITYLYDDQSPTQVKTVKFPIFSNSSDGISGTASYISQRAAGTSPFYYNAEIPETGASMKQVWFEIRGLKQSGGWTTADGYMYCRIDSNSDEPEMTFDGAMRDTYCFLYQTSTGIPSGYASNTLQTLNVITSGNANINCLGGEIILTYEFPVSAYTKIKTVSIFHSQSDGTSDGDFTAPVYLNETGISIKRIYALMHSSFDSTWSSNDLPVYSRVRDNDLFGGYSVDYSLLAQAAQASGFELFHDMTEGAVYWINGSTVNIRWTNNTNLGGIGTELRVTYTYTGEGKYTDYYSVFAGQSANEYASGASFNYAFDLFFPDPETPVGRKTLRDAYLIGNFIEGDNNVVQDPSTTMSVNSSGSQTANHRSTTENFFTSALVGFTGHIGVSSTTATANYTLTADPFNVSGAGRVLFEYLPVPSSPTALAQYRYDGTTQITTGTYTNVPAVHLKFSMKSKYPGDTITPVIEIKPYASSFDGAGLTTGTAQSYTATPIAVDISTTLAQGQYQWRASVYGDAGRSSWANFFTPSTIHFGIDLSTPPAPVLSLPANGSSTQNRSPQFSWSASVDTGGSGIKDYLFQFSDTPSFGSVLYSSQTALTSVTPPQSNQGVYYWRVRPYDNAGNYGSYSSTWSVIIDTTPPSAVATLSAPLHNFTTNQPALSFSWGPVTDSPAGVKNYILQISTSASFVPVRYSSTTSLSSASLSLIQSSYTWRVNVIDNALNYTTSTVRYTVVVDTNGPPAISTLSAPAHDTITQTQLQTFSWTGVSDAPSGVKNYILQLSTSPNFVPIRYSSATKLNSANITLIQSSYTWRVNVVDNALNYTTSTVRYTVVVDTTGPPAVSTLIAPAHDTVTQTR